jgi:hypothetical protein
VSSLEYLQLDVLRQILWFSILLLIALWSNTRNALTLYK